MNFDLTKIQLTPEVEAKIRSRLTGDLGIVADLIGVGNALKLHRRFSGTFLRVNAMPEIEREIRDEQIRADFDKGMCGVDLARKYHLTDRQIWNILGRPPKDPGILPLFPGM